MKKLLFLLQLTLLPFAAMAQESYPTIQLPTDEYDIMISEMKFTEASEKLKKAITQAKRRRKDVSVMESQLERSNRGMQALRGTDRLLVIDTVVVDKKSFLQAYNITDDLGKVTMSEDGTYTEFLTQRGNILYSVDNVNGRLQLCTYYMENGKRTEKSLVEGLGVSGDMNYPFLMPDGSTLYFAARAFDGLGNYDLYVTRYDYEDNRYYKAESLGFPYNSYANDYMMVINEEKNLGWFASDRYQPADKVCIYIFIPNSSRHPYDYENEDKNKVITAAKLRPITGTWTKANSAERQQALQTLDNMKKSSRKQRAYDFTLVINDQKTYHYYSDFRSAAARKQCELWQNKLAQLEDLSKNLEKQRATYHRNHNAYVKSQVLQLEQQYEQLLHETSEAEKQTRKLESF
ncbi:MAG: PD40 domain-containing protein [Bacteroidaceae bacterium]|nr:PD40 domain-containing protein [Bacteroidaceae bacterium]